MMRNKFLFALCAFLTNMSLLSSANAMSSIKWQENYHDAIKTAKGTSKPLLMFFTGSDWCGWCNKLEEEALDSAEFSQSAADKFVFLKLDFPLYSSQDPQLKNQNKQLQQQFGVRSFPTIVLFDAQQNQQIGTTGYRPGGGRQYAEYLLKMVNDFYSYKQRMSVLDRVKYSEKELKQLYDKSKELKIAQDSNRIVKLGMQCDNPLYFSIEQYRSLADAGQIHCQEAVLLRQQLLVADPNNEQAIHYQVALIEFETSCLQVQKENSFDSATAPLIAYIKKFGHTDRENLWRLQMIVSQVYLDGNQMPRALQHAEASYESAPAAARQQIAQTIQSIRSQIHSTLAHSSFGR
jgi:protein disulfide-isomerase